MKIGERIRRLREELGIPQTELASSVGITKQSLYKYENSIVTNIPSDKIEALAFRLQTTPAYLMGWTDLSSPENKKNDAITDIILRLRSDADFLALVEKLNSLPADKLSAIQAVLSALQ